MSTSEDPHLQKMAALGRVTRSLIHDFNNSLASIMGYADFLISDLPEGTEQHLFAQNIKHAAQQLQGSLDEIRRFSADGQNQIPDIPSGEDSASSPLVSSKSILLVEDREMVLHTVATMLRRENHKVECMIDGFMALDMIRENPEKYDLLITDYTMPEFSGKDLLAEIREDFKEMPVIVMSGDMESLHDLQNDKTNKNIFVLPKPITSENLALVIKATEFVRDNSIK